MAATQLRDRQRSQIVGPNTGKYPAIAADRRANGIADESVSHVDYPILSDGGRRRGHIYLEACQTAQRLEREPIYHLDYGRPRGAHVEDGEIGVDARDRKSTRLNSSH